jgi:hypothetical protein
MSMKPFSNSILICEKILTEADGVMSMIRMVDVFYITPKADVPIEKQLVQMTVLARVRASSGDDDEHTLQLQLIRPKKETAQIGEALKTKIPAKSPGGPQGMNLVAQFGVIPKQMGTHYIALLSDGVETARAEFTLAERKVEEAS